jgi:hypothetical protein
MAMAIDRISIVLQQQRQRRVEMGQRRWRKGATATGNGATAMIDRFRSCCNGDGDSDRSIAITMGLGQGHWGTGARATEQCCNRTVIAMGQGGVGGDVYVVLQHKTSTIVVDETMQNVWTAIIRDVLGWNKTCMICSGIVFGVSYLYSKVELVNAFRINSSLKWSKLYSNRVSNIISECSY